jgi:signal transduction histidine kinase
MCCVPFNSPDEDAGALNFYRTSPEPFGESDLRQAEQFAALVPDLYRAIGNRISLQLISYINEKLHRADLCGVEDYFSKEQTGQVFKEICGAVSEAFQCVETSIFLENKLETPDRHELAATTWPEPSLKSFHAADLDDGLTGWVFAHAMPVRIFDLANWERDVKATRKKYPGITWRDAIDLKSAAKKVLKLSPVENLPPLSFMAAPLVIGEKVLGVIRCVLPRRGLYFSDRDLHLLGLVAAQITRFWNNWLGRRESLEENQFLQSLVESIGELNDFVNKELAGGSPHENRIFARSLRVASSVIRSAEALDVRLFDDEHDDLYFAAVHGDFWNEGDQNSVQERKLRRFPVEYGAPASAGARVFVTGKTYVMSDAHEVPCQGETFAGIKEMIIAPIGVKGRAFGVLDVMTTRQGAFTQSARSAVQLLGKQIGLYCYLAYVIHQLSATRDHLDESVQLMQTLRNEQSQTFQDLTHQLKSPIRQAYTRIEALLKTGQLDDALDGKLRAIRGLCAKAGRVVTSTGLFADSLQERPIRLRPSHLRYDGAMKTVIEAATDNELMIDPERAIRFNVDREGFRVLESWDVLVDPDLFSQALNNILDNAGKYSYPHTTIKISAGLTNSGRFFVSIQNRGIPIRSHETQHVSERGWRGDSAMTVTGEGSGIGLWIVKHIMRAHEGELLVTPTSGAGLTDIRLVFPCRKLGLR